MELFKSKNIKFNNFDELYARLRFEIVHHFYSSFKARTVVCLKYNGDCLQKTKAKVYGKYWTHLKLTINPITNQTIVTNEKDN